MMELKLYNIFNQIKETKGKNAKIAIVKKYKDDPDFREILQFLYDDKVVVRMSTATLDVPLGDTELRRMATIREVIDYLKEHPTGGHDPIQYVQQYLRHVTEQDGAKVATFVKEVIAKEYKCGITYKSVNKAFEYPFVKSFNVQLAKAYADLPEKSRPESIGISLKLNGIRCVVIKSEDSVKMFTREGNELHGIVEVAAAYQEADIPYGVYDGELLYVRDEPGFHAITGNTKVLSDGDRFRMTSSRALQALKPGREIKELAHVIFDCMSEQEFFEGESNLIYAERQHQLYSVARGLRDFKRVEVLFPDYMGPFDDSIIQKFLDETEDKGLEGVMINDLNAVYETKRTSALLKCKRFKSADVVCTGVLEGKGKNKGTLGSLTADYRGTTVKVPWKDEDLRDHYWKNPEEIIGRVIEITYKEETRNSKNDNVSLQFPVFVAIRFDKTEKDVNID